MKEYQDALELINKLFSKFIKDTGLEMDNITWHIGLCTNARLDTFIYHFLKWT